MAKTAKTFIICTLPGCKGFYFALLTVLIVMDSVFREFCDFFLRVIRMRRMISTSVFAAAVGLSESTVRRLADRGDLKMHRTRGGHRRIPATELFRYAQETGATLRGATQPVDSPAGDLRGDTSHHHRLIGEALAVGNTEQFVASLRTLYRTGMTIAELCDGPLHEAIREIGSRWPHDPKSIFVEHRATAICVLGLGQLWSEIPPPVEGAIAAVGAAPERDPYVLPSLMASLVLRDCGYRETNLGPDTPLDVLTDTAEQERPAVVWLAITRPLQSMQYTREIDRLAAAIRRYGGRLLIGGENEATYDSRQAHRCGTMSELAQTAIALAKSETLR